MPLYYIYPFYTGILALIAFIIIPRQYICKLAAISILLGGIFDVGVVLFIKLLGVGGYLNFGPFGFWGIPFFPPIAWSIYFLMYFYLLPNNKIWAYIFPLISAVYSTFFSNILVNLGIFQWNYGKFIVPFLIYFSWHFSITWAFLHLINKKSDKFY